ncbi:MAG: TetR/AcrR family transcriptional regulator [Candidatus Coprenecus sp.]
MISKQQVLETSLTLFLDKGCKITMDEIASECGISKRTLYELFKDKSELLLESMSFHEEIKSNKTKGLYNPETGVLGVFLKIIDQGNEKMITVHFRFLAEVKKYYPEVYRQAIDEIRQKQYLNIKTLVEKGQEEGFFLDGIDVPSFTILFMSIAKAVEDIMNYNFMDVNKSFVIKCGMLLYLRGISTAKGVEMIDHYLKEKQIIKIIK